MTPLRHPAIALLYTIFLVSLFMGCVRSDDEELNSAPVTDAGRDAAAEGTVFCTRHLDCRDDEECTVDRCVDGQCRHTQGRLILSGENLGLPLRPDAEDITLEGDILLVARGADGVEMYSLSTAPASRLLAGPGRPDEELTCPCRGKAIGEECTLTDPECIAPLPGGMDAGVMLELSYTCQRPPAAPGEDALACIAEANAAPFTGAHLGPRGHILARAGRTVQILDGETGERIGAYRARDEVTDVVFVDDDTAAVAVYARGVEIVNVGNGVEPERESLTDTNGRALDITITGETLLVADGLVGLVAVDLTPDEEQTGVHPTIRTNGYTSRVVAVGERAVTNEGGAGFGVYQVTEDRFERLGTHPVQESVEEVGLAYPAVFTAARDKVRPYGIIEPGAPQSWTAVEINLKGACLPGTPGCVSQCDTDADCALEGNEVDQQRCIRGRCSFEWNLLDPGSPIRHFAMEGQRMIALLENGQFVLNEVTGCVECRVDDDCPVGQCVADRCTACVCNDDCTGDQYCERGACVGGCESDADCGAGETCTGGLCFDCQSDADCELGQFCLEGRCGNPADLADAGVDGMDESDDAPVRGTACEPPPDSGVSDTPDGGADAGMDAGMDAGVDAGN